jgi:hypothetical protein
VCYGLLILPPRSGDRISTEKLDTVSPNDLKGISVLFENDLYELARLMIKIHRAKDEEVTSQGTGSRQVSMSTLNEFDQFCGILTGISPDKIKLGSERRNLKYREENSVLCSELHSVTQSHTPSPRTK